jgi:hypothetical protein
VIEVVSVELLGIVAQLGWCGVIEKLRKQTFCVVQAQRRPRVLTFSEVLCSTYRHGPLSLASMTFVRISVVGRHQQPDEAPQPAISY